MTTLWRPTPIALFAGIAALMLSGCVNNFSRFYTAATVSRNVTLSPYSGSTQVFSSSDLQADGLKLAEQGYTRIGVASFQTGGRVTLDQLRDQAKEVGADTVLWSNRYLGSQQSVVPFMEYHPGTTSTTNTFGTVNANANVYGSSGYANVVGSANYNGYSTTTTPGTFSTEMMPITVQRYEYGATFWRKAKSFVLGIYPTNLPDNVRQQLQRNTGVVVAIVVVDSPAFRANILPGDVVVKINDWDIYSAEQFPDVVSMERGMASTVLVIRNGETKTIPVTLNP
jgi:PDZ domain